MSIRLLSLLKLKAEQLKKGKLRLTDEPERFPKGFFCQQNLPFSKRLSNGT